MSRPPNLMAVPGLSPLPLPRTGSPGKDNATMTDDTCSTRDAAALRDGDRIDVYLNGHTRYSGYVEDTMPQLNTVWIRELRTWERKMLSTDQCSISRSKT